MTDPSTAPTAARLEALRRESNLVLAEASQAQQLAAENLLEKAAVALHQGDRDKARAMVAGRRPWATTTTRTSTSARGACT